MKTMEVGIGADAAKLAGLQVDTLQKVRSGQITLCHWEWFNRLTKEERDWFAGSVTVDDRFFLMDIFRFTVPSDYDHSIQLTNFSNKNRKKFYFYNDAITDKNFAKATNQLIPGHTYEAKVFGIKSGKVVSSPDCLAFLKAQKAILVGAQGISVVWQQAKDNFPKGKRMVSFDEKDVLWQGSVGDHGVPYVLRYSDGDWGFDLGSFELDWGVDSRLLCLRDVD